MQIITTVDTSTRSVAAGRWRLVGACLVRTPSRIVTVVSFLFGKSCSDAEAGARRYHTSHPSVQSSIHPAGVHLTDLQICITLFSGVISIQSNEQVCSMTIIKFILGLPSQCPINLPSRNRDLRGLLVPVIVFECGDRHTQVSHVAPVCPVVHTPTR